MDKATKLILLEIQINNAAELLNAEVTRTTVIDRNGVNKKRIVITYDDLEFDEAGYDKRGY